MPLICTLCSLLVVESVIILMANAGFYLRNVYVSGLGDMAVSNTIGSNVFDILVGLGIPWGLQTMVVDYGTAVCIYT